MLTQADKKKLRKQLIIIGLAVAIVAFVHHILATADTEASQQLTADQLNDSKYLDNRYGISAAGWCENGADDYLRSVAKWDFAWDEGDKDDRFTQFRTYVKSPGVLTNISHKAKLQNGFGVYKHVTLTCDYDTQAKKVIGYHIEK
jgi:hypothetical protein